MATMREIRTRIRSIRNIEKITRAMKLVAAARLRRAQERVHAARPYAEIMQRMMQNLAQGGEGLAHPLLEIREQNNIAALVCTADRGLCGSYNTNLLRHAMRFLTTYEPEQVRLLTMGRKAEQFFDRRPYAVVDSREMGSGADLSFADVQPIVRQLRDMFEQREVDAVYVIYQKFINPIRQEPTTFQLLPLERPDSDEDDATATVQQDIIFEPSPEGLLRSLLPRYVDTQVYRAVAEAIASEHGARMSSMTAATENAGEIIDTLTLTFNRARQSAITTEISEIVTGAEALK